MENHLFAAKINANPPGNPARHGLPTIQGVIALFDADRGVLLALMDSSVITRRRTAAATAVAAKLLARADAGAVTMCGYGEQGKSQLRALAFLRTLVALLAVFGGILPRSLESVGCGILRRLSEKQLLPTHLFPSGAPNGSNL